MTSLCAEESLFVEFMVNDGNLNYNEGSEVNWWSGESEPLPPAAAVKGINLTAALTSNHRLIQTNC